MLLKNPFTKRKCIKKKWHFDAGKSKRKIAIVINWKGNRCKVSKYKAHYKFLIFRIFMSDYVFEVVRLNHSNDSHQCPILAADLLWDRKWTAYLYPSLTSRPCLDGFFIFYPIIKNNKVSCQYGTLMWIIAVLWWGHKTGTWDIWHTHCQFIIMFN